MAFSIYGMVNPNKHQFFQVKGSIHSPNCASWSQPPLGTWLGPAGPMHKIVLRDKNIWSKRMRYVERLGHKDYKLSIYHHRMGLQHAGLLGEVEMFMSISNSWPYLLSLPTSSKGENGQHTTPPAFRTILFYKGGPLRFSWSVGKPLSNISIKVISSISSPCKTKHLFFVVND